MLLVIFVCPDDCGFVWGDEKKIVWGDEKIFVCPDDHQFDLMISSSSPQTKQKLSVKTKLKSSGDMIIILSPLTITNLSGEMKKKSSGQTIFFVWTDVLGEKPIVSREPKKSSGEECHGRCLRSSGTHGHIFRLVRRPTYAPDDFNRLAHMFPKYHSPCDVTFVNEQRVQHVCCRNYWTLHLFPSR